jgi:hypothetical protein
MTTFHARWLPVAGFVAGVMLTLALHSVPATLRRAASTAGVPRRSAAEASRRRILAPARSAIPLASGPSRQRFLPSRALNLDPDARDPTLRTEHLRLLGAEPFLQLLPYRDREVGVALVNVTPQGAPVLQVTFQGSLATAERDVSRALANARDPGTEYALRYERLSR